MNYKHSEETKKKIGLANSVANKGKHFSRKTEFKKGMIPWNKGKKYSFELRKKISIAHLGQKPSQKQIEMTRLRWLGKNNPNYGKPMNQSLKEKLIKYHTGRKQSLEEKIKRSSLQRGYLGSNWKGGITPVNKIIRSSFTYRLWREAVFKRDDYICQRCDARGGKLQVHHIKPFSLFPELRFAIDNGVTLCKECHMETETWCGKIRTSKMQDYINFKEKI